MDETILDAVGNNAELKAKLRIQELEAQVLDIRMKCDELGRENTQLKREINQLKRMPLFVAMVVDVLEDGEVVPPPARK